MCLEKKTVDPMCRLWQLGVEDLCHVVTRCPAFHYLGISTVSQLMSLVIGSSGTSVWKQHFNSF